MTAVLRPGLLATGGLPATGNTTTNHGCVKPITLHPSAPPLHTQRRSRCVKWPITPSSMARPQPSVGGEEKL